ncbi:hypothetical protein [Bosea sp. NPDC055594]|jgi:hypothetical protein
MLSHFSASGDRRAWPADRQMMERSMTEGMANIAEAIRARAARKTSA